VSAGPVIILVPYSSFCSHDFNAQLDGESLEDVRENWEDEPIMDEWAKYAQSQMGK
jgi:hypothetical protein